MTKFRLLSEGYLEFTDFYMNLGVYLEEVLVRDTVES